MSVPAQDTHFRTLVDRLGVAIYAAVPGGVPGEATFTYMSNGAEVLLGFPPERWLQDPRFWIENVHPEDRARVAAEVGVAVHERRGADLEYRCFDSAGRERWVRNILQPVETGEVVAFSGVVVDLTEHRAAGVRLALLQELTDALARVLTAEQVADEVVRRGRAIVGAAAVAVFLREGDQVVLAAADGVVAADRAAPAAMAIRTGEAVRLDDGELVAMPLRADGRSLGALVLQMTDGEPLTPADVVVLEVLSRAAATALERAAHSSAEYAARRAAEEANAVLDAIITSAPEGFALFDTDLRYVRVNDALAEWNGVPAGDHVGRTASEVVPGLPVSDHEGPLRQVLATGAPVLDLELTAQLGDAVERTMLASLYPVPDADGEIGWIGAMITDISARKRAENRSAHLAELGTLLDEVVSVEERMTRLVDTLVPSLFDFCSVSFRESDGALERVATRGEGTPDISVPLIVRGRDLGVLAVGQNRAFGHDEAVFAEEVARRAALAVDNARLFEAEQLARDRTATQYALAAALAEALTAADVAAAALEEMIRAVGAEHGTLWQVTEDGRALEAIGWVGFTTAEMEPHLQQPLKERRPVADSIRARRTLWFASPEEIARAYPDMAPGLSERRLLSAAAIPLLSAGRVVGGVFLSSTRSYALSADDLALASALAAQAAQALERARFYEAERQVSVTLQRSLLPAELPEVDGVEFQLRYLPAAGLEAGGDFYEALELPDGTVLFACGDVVGRGATAAAAMGQLRSALRAFALVGGGPSVILQRLSAFADTIEAAMAATAVVGKLDLATGELHYACAGHPWPLLVNPDATADYLTEGRGVPLGCMPRPEYPEATVTLRPGCTLLLYTDGLTERRDEDVGVVLERLRSVTAASAVEPLSELLENAVAVAGAALRADDIALVGVRLTERGSATLRVTYPGDLAQVPVARAAMREWLGEHGFGGSMAADLLLAAGEAFANAVEHSGSETVDLELSLPAASQVAILVRDRGAWRPPPDETDRGRGFGLMRALVDDCAIDRGPDGTVVRMRRQAQASAATPPVTGGIGGVRRDGDRAVLTGDVDLASAAGVAAELRSVRVVDLSGVTYLDSTGARMLLDLAGAAVVAPRGGVARRTLDLSGLSSMLDVRDQ